MPYIPQEDRLKVKQLPATPGELNFAITKLLNNYLELCGLSYSTLNDCLGAVESAKLELYRRVVVPYEDRKIIENGDVYTVPRSRPIVEDDGK